MRGYEACNLLRSLMDVGEKTNNNNYDVKTILSGNSIYSQEFLTNE